MNRIGNVLLFFVVAFVVLRNVGWTAIQAGCAVLAALVVNKIHAEVERWNFKREKTKALLRYGLKPCEKHGGDMDVCPIHGPWCMACHSKCPGC